MPDPLKPTVTKHDNSTVTIEGEIPEADFTKHRKAALHAVGSDVSVDGFRKGHVPEDILIKHIGEYTLLREMAERALAEHYGSLIIEHKLDAIGRPEVTITKLAFGNPLGFKITTAVLPPVILPDYKSLAKDALATKSGAEPTVTEDEVNAFIKNILADRAKAARPEGAPITDTEPTLELNDEMTKTFGSFTSASDMREKIRDGMLLDKKRVAREERRMAIIDALLGNTKIIVPDILIEAELNKIMAQFMNDLERMGIGSADYFAKVGKDEATMRAEFRGDAEKRAKIQLILNEVAVAEKILPTKEEVEKEVAHLFAHHPSTKEGKDKDAEMESARIYVTTILVNEKVLAMLEKQK